jgi:hypothetical protein
VVRYVAVLVLTGPLYRWEERRQQRREALRSLPLAGR